ncbi:hypothetical protein [Ralstonia sp. Ralssp135]|uniref:hypothetical protein n=1 Tax=Ralstonia sp. Ralssp135 TaxID=3243016 RepID=UPI0039AF0C2F
MGILIQFPQPSTRTRPGTPSSTQSGGQDARLAGAYRRDLDRAVALLLEHVQSDAYDGVALVLKPTSSAHKPAFVVGGFYRHRLSDATHATMSLHLAIKLRARERDHTQNSVDAREPTTDTKMDTNMHPAILKATWDDATARYHRCEQLLRIAFGKQLRASPETTAILLSITQLHIETVANCLWELVRQPGRTTPQAKQETLTAIQLFRNLRAQVSAWMPPAGQEATYFSANASALSEEMFSESDSLLRQVESLLSTIAYADLSKCVGT